MERVRKAEQALRALERQGLTKEGRDWLITAVDPFHDTNVRPEGFPDLQTGASVVQLVKQTFTVAAPTQLGTGGTWDANIFVLPWLSNMVLSSYTPSAAPSLFSSTAAINGGNPVGGLVCIAGTPGASMALWNATSSLPAVTVSSLPIPNSYFQGPSRVIAMGFEITNTTAPLYKQGSVTAWRVPQNPLLVDGMLAAAVPSSFSFAQVVNAPESLAQAMVLLGSRTWDAAEGAYIVETLANTTLDSPIARPEVPMLYPLSVSTSPAVLPVGPALLSTTVGSATYATPATCFTHQFNTGGAYFSGLSQQTTLTVQFNCYIERFPSMQQSDLSVLTSPSPAYDLIAQELYNAMLADMPVGVMVKENGLGDWFAGAVRKVAPLVAGGLSMVPHPAAQAASKVIHAVMPTSTPPSSAGAGRVGGEKSSKKKKKPKSRK